MKTFKSKRIVVMNDNIDTDILIPKQYLKTVKRQGFQDYVFAPWRYKDNKIIESFPFNQEKYKNSKILITGENFGCGSSREHAAWALQDFGIHVIIAGSYSDIFYNNWLNNNHIPIKLSKEKREELLKFSDDDEIEIDLENQKIIIKDKEFEFDFPKNYKNRILRGLDSIGITLEYEKDIENFEKEKENEVKRFRDSN